MRRGPDTLKAQHTCRSSGNSAMATLTTLHAVTAPLKRLLPSWLWLPLRAIGTAIFTPIQFSLGTGHLRSSLTMSSVSRSGKPIPWYTYPCIDFLATRSMAGKHVLEFGTGNSTLWWADKAERVLGFESDPTWRDRLLAYGLRNVTIRLVPEDQGKGIEIVRRAIAETGVHFDVVIIDGLWRRDLIDVAIEVVRKTGIIICDNAEGYGFYEGFAGRGFSRVDFFGNAPGVLLPHCTSIFFREDAWVFDEKERVPIARPA